MTYASDLTVTSALAYVSDQTGTVTLLLQLPWPMLVTLLVWYHGHVSDLTVTVALAYVSDLSGTVTLLVVV